MTEAIDLNACVRMVAKMDPLRWTGEVTEIVGLVVESRGPAAGIGDFCEITTRDGRRIRAPRLFDLERRRGGRSLE